MQGSNGGLPTIHTQGRAYSKFKVQSSDVLQDMRVNVSVEGHEQILWYKERFLSDDEIIENVVHNPTSTICWTIHRPKRGWYMRIRAPSFPPGMFIPLMPVPPASMHHVDAALTFSSRTNALAPSRTPASAHSYPPTSPPVVVVVEPPSPTDTDVSEVNLDAVVESMKPAAAVKKPPPPPTQITDFILAPYTGTVQPEAPSLLSRAFSFLKTHAPHHSNSFTLTRMSAGGAPPPYTPAAPIGTPPMPDNLPLLTFHDHTPVLTVRSITGLLEIDIEEERLLGIDTSFWIAVALTYLEFLEERESYLAANSD
ncbi:hypothetical protein PC9H_011689 [Pleurotus ostreatus]|uniref:Uncharacterized protein n=1 Tax=Pleurotus ostreatus TaxID=5322 RepID=A0A8H7DPH0_PLEOS|nr:uncharacterized protein PC9H_011689 [Pleurotus ostreatus]KAF7421169.1 hypothetical protein PC9H_011689 [Pleurotus ostreatus]KAJ8690716.1 hypothetical protein PTI98_012122 [Pleurotus ostreatus]